MSAEGLVAAELGPGWTSWAILIALAAAGCAPRASESQVLADAASAADNADTDPEELDQGDFMKGPPPALEGPLTYSGRVQPIFRYYCTPCHEGSTPKGCVGGTCFVSFHEAFSYAAYNVICPNMNKAQCGMVRIRNSLPTSGLPDEDKLIGPNDRPIVLDDVYVSTLQAWLDAGAPK